MSIGKFLVRKRRTIKIICWGDYDFLIKAAKAENRKLKSLGRDERLDVLRMSGIGNFGQLVVTR